jgi:hypothetical protein
MTPGKSNTSVLTDTTQICSFLRLTARGESMPKARFVKEKDVVKEKDCAEVRE